MRIRFLAIAALVLSALLAVPATAATDKVDDIWFGQIVHHNRHFDYRGRACPTSAEMCINIVATYRVVPLSPEAATNLRRAAGGQARLVGYRAPSANRRHNAVLYVRRVEKA